MIAKTTKQKYNWPTKSSFKKKKKQYQFSISLS